MKSVSVRDFQLKASRYLKELPIVLTRYNIPVAQIVPIKKRGENPKKIEEVEYVSEGYSQEDSDSF